MTPQHSARPAVVVVSAAFVAGIALWLSRASFDVAGTIDSPVRVAMLPALPELAGLIVLTLLIAAAIAFMLGWTPAAADVLSPSFALAFLGLPYLPWLPDWLPALRLLAGPGRSLVWIVVLGQVLWHLARELKERRRSSLARGPAEAGHHAPEFVVVFAVSLAAYVWAFSRIAGVFDVLPLRLVAAAGVAGLIWLSALAVSQSKASATFAWAAVCLSAPFLLNSREFVPGAFIDLFNTVRNLHAARLVSMAAGVPGVLFDQEFGLLAYAPVLLLGFLGLAEMARERSRRALTLVLSVTVVALIGLAGSLDPWWSDAMMPGKTVLLVLPLLAPPIAWLHTRAGGHAGRRAGLQLLLLISLAVTLTIVHDISRVPLPQEGDGSSSILQWVSPTWPLTSDAPSYIATPPSGAWPRAAVWLAAFATAGWLMSRRTRAGGRTSLFAMTTTLVAVLAVTSISAAFLRGEEPSRFDPEGRVLFPMLETFSPVARPIGVKYNPFSIVSPLELPPLFSLSALPGQRLNRQPIRVVLNARFRLPAGEYQLDIQGSDLAGSVAKASVALQIGREGRPLETWPLPLVPGGWVQHRFRLPLNAEFVGFRASRQVERAIAALRLSPLSVEEVPKRYETPTLLAAADFGVARAFFHDSGAYAEAEGFWIKGRTTVRATILKLSSSDTSITLAIHSGPRPNTVTLATTDWEKRLDLVPGVTTRISVPAKSGDSFIPLSVTTADGFTPSELEPGSKDRRVLGAWVAFIPDDSSRTSGAP